MKKSVLLIHGLFTNELVMKYLEKRFIENGYVVYQFNYRSVKYSEKTLKDFDRFLVSVKENVNIIAHSLGGLLVRNYIQSYSKESSKIESFVTIGTPHNKSECAQSVNNTMFKGFLGTACESGLTKELPSWKSSIPLGCIAGSHESIFGANLFLFNKRKLGENDGTVFVKEAILNNCTDSIVLPGSHTGLLFKPQVFEQCLYFIENKKFKTI